MSGGFSGDSRWLLGLSEELRRFRRWFSKNFKTLRGFRARRDCRFKRFQCISVDCRVFRGASGTFSRVKRKPTDASGGFFGGFEEFQ